MNATMTVDVPVSHRLTIDVPREVPAGLVDIVFSPQAALPSDEERSGFGCLKGQIKMSDDFDEPLEDFKDYM